MLFYNRPVNRPLSIVLRIIMILLPFIFLLLSFNNLFAAQVTVTWSPSPDSRVEGYKLYYGKSADIDDIIDAGSQTYCDVTNLDEGTTYYFAATAYDKYGNESDFSEIVTYEVKTTDDESPPIFYGNLSATLESLPANIDLTLEGLTGWAHWGLNTASCYNYKKGAESKIGNFILIGKESPRRFDDARAAYSWFDGMPTSNVSWITSGLYFKGIGNGYKLVVPADVFTQTLQIYLGGWRAKGRLVAYLTDGSAETFSARIGNPDGIFDHVLELNFAAAGKADLIVQYTVEDNYNSWGNVTLQAATLY